MDNKAMAVLIAGLAILGLPHAAAAAGARPQTGPVAVTFGPDVQLSIDVPSQGKTADRVEPTIAVNPTDPRTLVAGYHLRDVRSPNDHGCHLVHTADAGVTWTASGPVPLATSRDACVDSSLAADASGNFYYAFLDEQIDTAFGRGFIPHIDLRVAKSTDGGRTFPTWSIAAAGDPNAFVFVDKPYMAVDARPRSPFTGTIYLAYTLIDSDGFSIRVVASRDGGKTWSAPLDVVSNLPGPEFFYLTGPGPRGSAGPVDDITANSNPTAGIAPDGTIYVAWADVSEGSCKDTGIFVLTCVNADVRLSVSRDGGGSWTRPVKVSDETNATDQFMPWVAVHPSGLLSLIWEDKRLDPDNFNYDIFYTTTRDGVTFLPNVRVSSATSQVTTEYNGGDYSNLAVTADRIFPVWNDSRFVNVETFTARGTLRP